MKPIWFERKILNWKFRAEPDPIPIWHELCFYLTLGTERPGKGLQKSVECIDCKFTLLPDEAFGIHPGIIVNYDNSDIDRMSQMNDLSLA